MTVWASVTKLRPVLKPHCKIFHFHGRLQLVLRLKLLVEESLPSNPYKKLRNCSTNWMAVLLSKSSNSRGTSVLTEHI